MKKDFKRFDMCIPPKKVKWFLKPLIPLIVNSGIKKLKAGVLNTLIVDRCKIVNKTANIKYEYKEVTNSILFI